MIRFKLSVELTPKQLGQFMRVALLLAVLFG